MNRTAERQIYRLAELAKLLENIPRRLYDQRNIVTEESKCGTVACAFGHAMHSKKFPGLRNKLVLAKDAYGRYDVLSRESGEAVSLRNVADNYFGPNSWKTIFSRYAYDQFNVVPEAVTPSMVVQRIHKVIASREKAEFKHLTGKSI
jgi:hypothetical protein